MESDAITSSEFDPPISIIIRTFNDGQNLTKIFQILDEQYYNGTIEIILVDTSSTDETINLGRERNATIVNITKDEFNYPLSLNLGVEQASNEIILEIVGHAFPLRNDWIQCAVKHLSNSDSNIAGVFAPPIAYKDSNIFEKLFFLQGFLYSRYRGPFIVKGLNKYVGLFGATNIAFLKRYWEQHHFNEEYGAGGEDIEWAEWAISQGYDIICDWRFTVRHSHRLNIFGIFKQRKHWEKMGKPNKFDYSDLQFRPDLKAKKNK